MKVKAKHWINVDGTWHKAGEEFEISTSDIDALKDIVKIAETPVNSSMDEYQEETESPKHRGRPKKAESDK